MGSISGKGILNEFFDLWTAKVRSGLTPAAGLAEIEREQPDLCLFYKIINQPTEGGKK